MCMLACLYGPPGICWLQLVAFLRSYAPSASSDHRYFFLPGCYHRRQRRRTQPPRDLGSEDGSDERFWRTMEGSQELSELHIHTTIAEAPRGYRRPERWLGIAGR
ncbi:hypothetical protein QR685DRAFT_530781 [Neurospora intermedia]|uniref:Secreted protein n=1 Tax=Neurospora intermedia TaxID=5142 RepID=A0ABR3D7M8_NEUIN